MPNAYLVCGTDPMNALGDTALSSRLASLGYTVTVVDDGAAAPADDGRLVVIAESVASASVNTKYRLWSGPVMMLEAAVWDDAGLTTAAGTPVTDTTWEVTDIDAGVPVGTVTHTSANTSANNAAYVSTAQVVAGVEVLATRTGNPASAVLLRGETGLSLDGGGTAPNRRVALGWFDRAYNAATADGWTVFDTQVEWLDPSAPAVPVVANHRITLPGGTSGVPVLGDADYTAVVRVRPLDTARQARVITRWYSAAGSFISEAVSASTATSLAASTDIFSLVTSPPNAAYASLVLEALSVAHGERFRWDLAGVITGHGDDWVVGGQTAAAFGFVIRRAVSADGGATWEWAEVRGASLEIPLEPTVPGVPVASIVDREVPLNKLVKYEATARVTV